MPQLWLTYDEIAEAFDCGSEVAEQAVLSGGWTRKRSHDALIRALLPQDVMRAYMIKFVAKQQRHTAVRNGFEPAAASTARMPALLRAA